jgi:hypothetical protein
MGPFSLQKNLGEGRVVQKFKSQSNKTGGEIVMTLQSLLTFYINYR